MGVASAAFLAFGTDEETYLALYAAGVFILLAMTGWAASKRLFRYQREDPSARGVAVLVGAVVAALLTTGATLIIFTERFTEGAWTYLLMIPALYLTFGYFRSRLGPPTSVEDRIGQAIGGTTHADSDSTLCAIEASLGVNRILVPLDGSELSATALPVATELAASSAPRL